MLGSFCNSCRKGHISVWGFCFCSPSPVRPSFSASSSVRRSVRHLISIKLTRSNAVWSVFEEPIAVEERNNGNLGADLDLRHIASRTASLIIMTSDCDQFFRRIPFASVSVVHVPIVAHPRPSLSLRRLQVTCSCGCSGVACSVVWSSAV